MDQLTLFKKIDGALYPYDDDAIEMMQKVGFGDVVKCQVRRCRNYQHHKKFMALMRYAFDRFEPEPLMYKGVQAEKSFDRFRKDMMIVAGYYDPTFDIKGNLRLEAKSISFDSMASDEFDRVYSDMLDAVIARVLTDHKKHDLYSIVDKLAGFA